jgi:hypothetical protein
MKKTLKNILLTAGLALPLAFGSCEPENYPPLAKIDVDPTHAEAPAYIKVKVTGDDPEGVEDIRKYSLYVDNGLIKTKSTPIDTALTFDGPGTYRIYGEVVDSKNQSNKTPKKSVEVYSGPYISQSASLINDAQINYFATLHRKDNAELKIKKDGNSFLELLIYDAGSSRQHDYQKTFTYEDGFTKGNYEFILTADDLEKKSSVEIPNYIPTVSLSGIVGELMEGSEMAVTLPEPHDKNPEDLPVLYQSATSLDGKTQLELNGNELKIKSLSGHFGNYQVEVGFGSEAGGLDKLILNGHIKKDTRIKINPFVSTNSNGADYDLLTTKEQRDNYIQERLNEDWVSEVSPTRPSDPYDWDCSEYSKQLMINFHGFFGDNGDNVAGLPGYSGDNLDSIYYYHGTMKDNGKYGLPVYLVQLPRGSGHRMNAILTGDNAEDFKDWNFVEPQFDQINVQPGQAYMIGDSRVIIHSCWVNQQEQVAQIDCVPILEFKIENGVPTLTWKNPSFNLNLITQRE